MNKKTTYFLENHFPWKTSIFIPNTIYKFDQRVVAKQCISNGFQINRPLELHPSEMVSFPTGNIEKKQIKLPCKQAS